MFLCLDKKLNNKKVQTILFQIQVLAAIIIQISSYRLAGQDMKPKHKLSYFGAGDPRANVSRNKKYVRVMQFSLPMGIPTLFVFTCVLLLCLNPSHCAEDESQGM